MVRGNRSLDLVRVLAALLVVVTHVRQLLFAPWAESPHTPVASAFNLLGSLGHGAVLVFFVLSGFWVGGSVIGALRAGRFSVRGYAVARLTRLWIVLAPAIALTVLVGTVGLTLLGDRALFAPGSPVFDYDLRARLQPEVGLGNLLFVQTVLVPPLGANDALWSLAWEFWFYALFPLLAVGLAASRPGRVRAAALLACAAALAVLGPAIAAGFAAWLLGAAVAWRRTAVEAWWRAQRAPAAWRAAALSALAVALACGAVEPGPLTDLTVAVAAAALVVTLVVDPALPRPLALVSRGAGWSFSLYAVHMPLGVLLVGWLGPARPASWLATPGHLAAAAGLTAVLLVAGWAFAQLTERHTGRLRARLPAPRTSPAGRVVTP